MREPVLRERLETRKRGGSPDGSWSLRGRRRLASSSSGQEWPLAGQESAPLLQEEGKKGRNGCMRECCIWRESPCLVCVPE